MKYSDILSSLPTLNKKQLAALKITIEHLLGNEAIIDDPTRDLFHALTIVLGMQRMSFESFHKTATFKTWKKRAYACVEFIDETWPEAQSSKITRMALMTFLMSIQLETIKEWGVPVTLNSMVNALPSLEASFDHAFPGYRESGMAHLILKNMQRSKPNAPRKPKSTG